MGDRLRQAWDDTSDYRKPRPVETDRVRGISGLPAAIAAIWWAWVPLVLGIWWAFINIFPSGIGSLHRSLHLFIVRHVLASGGGVYGLATEMWSFLAIGFLGTALIMLFLDKNGMSRSELAIIVVSFLVSIGLFVVPVTKGIYGGVDDSVNPFQRATTIHVEDARLKGVHPSSLSLFFGQTEASPMFERKDSDNKVIGAQVGPMKVVQEKMPNDLLQLEERNAAAAGALATLHQKTSGGSNRNVFDDTLTYAYGAPVGAKEGDPAANQKVTYPQVNRWTALLDVADTDADNYTNSLAGVAEWVGGSPDAHTCLFGGKNNESNLFNRAFGGNHMNSLPNVIYKAFPDLVWAKIDISGYCNAKDHPVIVIATRCNASHTKPGSAYARTVLAPCGILKLTGSESGDIVPGQNLVYIPNVKAGEYPVPVYPTTSAQDQRNFSSWWAGRGNTKANFGYQPSDFSSQSDNNGEYILRSRLNGGIYAVTPEQANASGKRLDNWNFIRMDSVTRGTFNNLDAYVLNDDDPRAIAPSTIDNSAQAIVNYANLIPNALANGNKLVEYLPIGPNRYRGFLLNNNHFTVMYVDLSPDNSQPAVVTKLDPITGGVAQQMTVSDSDLKRGQGQNGQNNNPGSGNANPGSPNGTCANITAQTVQSASVADLEACLNASKLAEAEMIRRLKAQQGSVPSTAGSGNPAPVPSRTG